MELVNGFNLLMLFLPVVLLVLVVLFTWYRYGVKAELLPHVLQAIVMVFKFSEERIAEGSPLDAIDKKKLVEIFYNTQLPIDKRVKISREGWGDIVEYWYSIAAAVWDNSAAGLRDAFDEWEANRE